MISRCIVVSYAHLFDIRAYVGRICMHIGVLRVASFYFDLIHNMMKRITEYSNTCIPELLAICLLPLYRGGVYETS